MDMLYEKINYNDLYMYFKFHKHQTNEFRKQQLQNFFISSCFGYLVIIN